jgi:heme-degrading monooxygenase HmoA
VIGRIWHGYTPPAQADEYEALLRDEIFTGIEGRSIDGFREIQLFRRDMRNEGDAGDEVEFITIMWFDSWDAVRAFAGEDYEASVVPPAARALLARFDERSQHYEVRERRTS